MKYNLHITKSTEIDLIRAADYIEYNLLNPQAANDLLDKAEKAICKLSEMPQIHQLVEDPVLKSWGIRFVLVDDYMACLRSAMMSSGSSIPTENLISSVFPTYTIILERRLESRRSWSKSARL